MTGTTDCEARGIRTKGCGCSYCTDTAILKDGETSRYPMMFLDATQEQVKVWSDSVFQRAGVPIRPSAEEPADSKPATDAQAWDARIFDLAGVPMKPEARARKGDDAPPVLDAAAQPWNDAMFAKAGVPGHHDTSRANERARLIADGCPDEWADAVAEHNRLLRSGMHAQAAQERERVRRENAEARGQAQTASESDSWDKAVREFNRTMRRAGLTPDPGGRAA